MGARESSSGEAQITIDDLVEKSESGEGDADDDGEGCPSIVDTKKLKHLQANDPTLSRIKEQAERDKRDCFWQDGLLYRRWNPTENEGVDNMVVNQLVLPVQCRESLMKSAHAIPASGHLGRRKTLSRIQQQFFQPGISRDVTEYCRCCPACQKSAGRRARNMAQMTLVPVVEEPFKRVAMDIVGPLNRKSQCESVHPGDE